MYRRLIILTAIILVALCALGLLGYDAVHKWAQGLEGTRLGEFAEVAEQIRQDVKRKLDDFVRAEQQRPYTDYLYSYVPENYLNAQQQLEPPSLRSPLADQVSNGFAYGYFQIEADGRVITPYVPPGQAIATSSDDKTREMASQFANIRANVLPSVSAGSLRAGSNNYANNEQNFNSRNGAQVAQNRAQKSLPIESLNQDAQVAQVLTQQRDVAMSNSAVRPNDPASQQAAQQVQQPTQRKPASDTVQIRIEPFVPIVVGGGQPKAFAGQVFLLRRVQIENRSILQGFQLDESHLMAEVRESAGRFMREGMSFDLPQTEESDPNATQSPKPNAYSLQPLPPAYTAVLAFGFGDLILNLAEIDPAWIARRVGELQHVYIAIVTVVAAAVALALASLWHNVRAQVRLARRKDDFISAVSHELRTPLTSIRMYAEMLERNWVKSDDKRTEYQRNLRQESERLSRLVDNVLDFSRIQKGRKKYAFEPGDLNASVAAVCDIMRPYAEQYGFALRRDLGTLPQVAFDRDAVTQIAVNLIDNAVKYARGAEDKTITVRTRLDGPCVVLEVEDRGPGIPSRLRKKVFEQFYRCDEDLPATDKPPHASAVAGTGLGLTLVKRFAEAHRGSVEIASAQPTGVIVRVRLARA
jgi:signal transduction histidine kinase